MADLGTYVLFGGFAATTLTAGLAVYGLTNEFRDAGGNLNAHGKRAILGTAALGVLSIGLFALQYFLDRTAEAEQRQKDRTTLELLELAGLPTVDTYSLTLEYADDEALEAMHRNFWETIDRCGDPPYALELGKSTLFSYGENPSYDKYFSRGASILTFSDSCEHSPGAIGWAFLNDWIAYMGKPQVFISAFGPDPNVSSNDLSLFDEFDYQPFSQPWQSSRFYYGFHRRSERSEMHLVRVPPHELERGFASIASLIGGHFEISVRPTLGQDIGGYSSSAEKAGNARNITRFNLNLTNGTVLRLGGAKLVERGDHGAEFRIDMPKTIEELIALLRKPAVN